jgi:hypothetical protein
MDVLVDLAAAIEEAQPAGPCRLRIAKVTAVGTDGRLQTDLTGTAWLRRNTNASGFAVDDRVLVLQQGATAVAICRVSGLLGEKASSAPAFAATFNPGTLASWDATLRVTLTGNITTLNVPSNAQTGDRVRYVFTQDGTGGRTVAFAAGYKVNWAPTTTAGKVNVIDFEYDGTNWVQTGSATNL